MRLFLLSRKPRFYFIKLPQETDKVYFDIGWPVGQATVSNSLDFQALHLLEHIFCSFLRQKRNYKSLDISGSISLDRTRFSFTFNKKNYLQVLGDTLNSLTHLSLADIERYYAVEKLAAENEEIIKYNERRYLFLTLIEKIVLSAPKLYFRRIRNPVRYNVKPKQIFRFYQKLISYQPTLFIGSHNLSDKDRDEIKKIVKAIFSAADNKPPKVEFKISIKAGIKKTVSLGKSAINRKKVKSAFVFFVFPAIGKNNKELKQQIALGVLYDLLTFNYPHYKNLKLYLRDKGFYKINKVNVRTPYYGLHILYSNVPQSRVPILIKEMKSFFANYLEEPSFSKVFSAFKKQFISYNKDCSRSNSIYYDAVDYLFDYQKFPDFNKYMKSISEKYLRRIKNRYFNFQKVNIIVVK